MNNLKKFEYYDQSGSEETVVQSQGLLREETPSISLSIDELSNLMAKAHRKVREMRLGETDPQDMDMFLSQVGNVRIFLKK
jgi:hypothetical protein